MLSIDDINFMQSETMCTLSLYCTSVKCKNIKCKAGKDHNRSALLFQVRNDRERYVIDYINLCVVQP